MEESPKRWSIKPKLHRKFHINNYLQARENGLKKYVGFDDDLFAQIYSQIDKHHVSKYNALASHPERRGGGIFNLEFSPKGHVLIAACERNCILIYDPSDQKQIFGIDNAHENCVNCVRFLEDDVFATCSDDNTIKLWDLRNIKKKALKTLHGHTNWVKNIEYSSRDKVMVTSAFDGSIYAWDLTSPTENSMLYEKVFLTNGLMRTKLSPDGSQMIISTTSGYMIIIHDLNLNTLASDFKSFKPVLYRLMQTSGQSFPAGTVFNHLFHPSRRKNRVEFIDDFTVEAEVISSLQIHPHGWNAVSRCLSRNETDEVTSVHDIQKRNPADYENSYDNFANVVELPPNDSDEDEHEENPEDVDLIPHRPTDLWMGYTSHHQHTRERHPNMYGSFMLPAMGIINSGLIGGANFELYFQEHPEERNKVIINLPRLTHYIKEQNVGRGFIKELCYSPDGRLICSPFNKGIRILGFSDRFEELHSCVPNEPKELTTLMELSFYHSSIVVSCKFSPRNAHLVSGCLNGEIVWYQPLF